MKNKKIISFAILFSFFLIGSLALSGPVSAIDSVQFTPQVDIPSSGFEGGKIMTKSDTSYIGEYAKGLYNYGLTIAGILAAIVIMAAGLLWLTSGGNASKVGQAKELITGSLVGLVILASAWFILNTINPNLVKMRVQNIETIKEMNIKALSCEDATASSTCKNIAFCTWKNDRCLGKIEAGEAKCDTDKSKVPGKIVCCCQSAPSGELVYCKWATHLGEAWAEGPGGTPSAGPCAACGSANYIRVKDADTYRCQKAYDEEQAAKNDPTIDPRIGCEGKIEGSSCLVVTDGAGLQEGFCLNNTCEWCLMPGYACGDRRDDFKCATNAGLGRVCGNERHGECRWKANRPNVCEATD